MSASARWPGIMAASPRRLRRVTGVGANALLGGYKTSIALQPVSVEGI
jgi:Protein of unknown function (DUF992)